MKKTYTIRIERRETFTFDVDVESNTVADAIKIVEERYANGEFDGERDLYYCPDNIEDDVFCVQEKGGRPCLK